MVYAEPQIRVYADIVSRRHRRVEPLSQPAATKLPPEEWTLAFEAEYEKVVVDPAAVYNSRREATRIRTPVIGTQPDLVSRNLPKL